MIVCIALLYIGVFVFGMAFMVLCVHVVNCSTEGRAYIKLSAEGEEKRCER